MCQRRRRLKRICRCKPFHWVKDLNRTEASLEGRSVQILRHFTIQYDFHWFSVQVCPPISNKHETSKRPSWHAHWPGNWSAYFSASIHNWPIRITQVSSKCDRALIDFRSSHSDQSQFISRPQGVFTTSQIETRLFQQMSSLTRHTLSSAHLLVTCPTVLHQCKWSTESQGP